MANEFPGKLVLSTLIEDGTGESTESSDVSPSRPDFNADPADDPVVDLLGDPSLSESFQGGGEVAKKPWKDPCGDTCDANKGTGGLKRAVTVIGQFRVFRD